MFTVREVLRRALLKFRGIDHEEELSAADARDGLDALESQYLEWVHGGMFGRLNDVLASANYTAKEQDRVANAVDSNIDVTLPEFITDDVTGEVRSPKDLSLVVIVGETTGYYLYSRPVGAWVALTGLTLDQAAPLAERSLDGLASVLAERIAGEYVDNLPQSVIKAANAYRELLTYKNVSPRSETPISYI